MLIHHCRAVGAATLFHRMFYMEAQELLCQLMPDMIPDCDGLWDDPMTPKIKHCQPYKIISTNYTFTAQWNSLPVQIPAIKPKASFSWEVNHFLCATSSLAFFGGGLCCYWPVMLCHYKKNLAYLFSISIKQSARSLKCMQEHYSILWKVAEIWNNLTLTQLPTSKSSFQYTNKKKSELCTQNQEFLYQEPHTPLYPGLVHLATLLKFKDFKFLKLVIFSRTFSLSYSLEGGRNFK